ncbi:hypothetical protein [Mesorhizobium sp. M0244]|uniref:hypothetical protein n=1 Tax=Mesorhizobium sp. M0244 TaxID=2956926 RepID=UPI00333A1A87
MIDIGSLVRGAPLLQYLEQRIPDLRLIERAVRNLKVKCRQVAAVQVTDQVGGAKL